MLVSVGRALNMEENSQDFVLKKIGINEGFCEYL